MRTAVAVPLTMLAAQVLLIAGLALTAGLDGSGLGPAGWAVGLASAGGMSLALARGRTYWSTYRLGPADWVTLTRAALTVGVAALVADSFTDSVPVALLVSLASLALVLDLVDGQVARRTGTTSALGGQMDGEVDAFLILVLSVYVARSAGAWVLAIGVMRVRVPRRSVTRCHGCVRRCRCGTGARSSARRRGSSLTVAAAQVLPSGVADVALAAALVLLAESFGRDVWWSWSHRDREAAAAEPDESARSSPPC